MTIDSKKLLDQVSLQLLTELQTEGRLSFAELGRRVGLSLPAVAERVRRLEEAGVITGYHAKINLPAIGLPVMAFVRLSTTSDHYPAVIALAQTLPQVLECHHLTGVDSFIIKVVSPSLSELEKLINRFGGHGATATAIVLSSPVNQCGPTPLPLTPSK